MLLIGADWDPWVILVWTGGAAAVAAGVAYVGLRYVAMGIARRVAEATERGIAQSINKGLGDRGPRTGPGIPDALRAAYLADIARLTRVMDRLIPLPIVGGIGLDALLGLIPVAGDVISLAVSSLIVFRAAQLGAPRDLIVRLVAIQCTDLLLGAVPVVGDLIDVAYQANVRSSRLIDEWLAGAGSSR